MDRNREGRRSSNMAASNGLSRRRQQRNTRDSTEEDGGTELQETARLRDRGGNKRERDRELSSRNKRSRRGGGDRLVQGSNKEEGEETTEESFGYEDDYEIEDGGGSRLRPPPRVVKQVPGFRVAADEMIGVSVPRKARSASLKRAHESWVSGNGGFGSEDRRASISPAASRSFETASPPSLNVSDRKKTKPSGPKTRLPKVSKSSTSSVQEDIDMEIAEVLYGLRKQSHGSKEEEKSENGLQKLDSMDANDSKSSPNSNFAQTSILNQNNASASDSLIGLASKRQKMDADSVMVENSLIALEVTDEREDANMEISSPKSGKTSFYAESCDVSHEMVASKLASGSLESQEDAIKQQDGKPAVEESGVSTKDKPVLPEGKSSVCNKLDVDFNDSVLKKSTSTMSKVESQREEKFKIDLMAPPPMASSPEQDGFVDLSSDPKPTAQDVEMKMENMVKNEELADSLVKKEGVIIEEKVKTVGEKHGSKLDFEKPNRNVQQKLQPKAMIPKVETTAQSGSVPLPIALPGWPSNLPPLGYMPSFQTVVPTDGTNGSSKALQPPQFTQQPRPKRCATHHYIACNVRLHQQFTKMNHFWPAATGSAALCGAKPKNLNAMPSAENMIIGNPLQRSFPVVNPNPTQDKVQALANTLLTRKDRGSESATLMDTAQKQQLVLHQPPQPAPAGNLMHGPTFIFSLNQHQASSAAMTSQTGPSKSASSINNASSSGNAIAGVTTNSSALPAMAAAVSFSYPNLAANETPYLTILPNNGYPFPISTPVGNAPTFRGGTPAQALSFFNGSFYSSQMLHPSQLQQQQSQPVVQPGHQNASTSSGSSSSHKQPQIQQLRGGHVSTNNFLTSTVMQSQQLPNQHVPSHQSRKLEAEMSGESTPTIADTRASKKKGVNGPNFMVPLQPNFGLMASTTVGGSGNHGEKQQQQHQLSQEKNLKGGFELVPSQAFAMSFASFKGSKTVSNLNFSAMSQNPPILQSFPDMTRQGYQVVSATQATQKKNHQLSEGKTGGSSTNPDDGKKATLGKSSTGIGQTLIFDNSARTLNFASSPFPGNWPSHSTTTTSIPMAANSSSTSQHQQLVQLQKQHILHQQPQQPVGAAESKAPTSSSLPLPSIGAKFSNNAPIFSQTQARGNSSPQNPQWKNSSGTPSSQAPLTSLSASNTVHKNASQQQGRVPQGHTQISFGPSSKSALPSQGQQISSSNQSSSSGGNSRTTSMNAKANSSVPAIQSQQSENSSSGNAQKSSPVCARNVPSILSACPSHLSELKY